jgi:hypothetical protein
MDTQLLPDNLRHCQVRHASLSVCCAGQLAEIEERWTKCQRLPEYGNVVNRQPLQMLNFAAL